MIATALDDFTAPPSSKLLGWHLLDARPGDGWIRIGFDGERIFATRPVSSRAASSRPCSTTPWARRYSS